MKTADYIKCFSVSLLLSFWAGSLSAQAEKKETIDPPVTVADILNTANVPLSEEQAKQLKEFDPEKGSSSFLKLYQMFDDKQKDALKKALGTLPARGNIPETPRSLFLVIILENLNNPLTQGQVDQLKVLSTDPNSAQKLNSIFTDDQKKAMDSLQKKSK
jgi:hypothetical protein